MPREISAVALYVPRVCIGAQPRRCSHANHANCSPTASTDAPNDNGDRLAASSPRRAAPRETRSGDRPTWIDPCLRLAETINDMISPLWSIVFGSVLRQHHYHL
jgi:hypothetical protein